MRTGAPAGPSAGRRAPFPRPGSVPRNRSQATYVLLALSAISFVALRSLGFFSVAQVQRVLDDRRRNLHVRREVRRIGETLRAARGVEDVWEGVRVAARVLGASAVALHLPDVAPGDRDERAEGFDEAGPELFRARYALTPERPGDTHVELGWSDRRGGVDRDTEIAVELFCDYLSTALERIGPYADQPAALPPVARAANDGER